MDTEFVRSATSKQIPHGVMTPMTIKFFQNTVKCVLIVCLAALFCGQSRADVSEKKDDQFKPQATSDVQQSNAFSKLSQDEKKRLFCSLPGEKKESC